MTDQDTPPVTLDTRQIREKLERLSRSQLNSVWFEVFQSDADDDFPNREKSEIVIKLITRAKTTAEIETLLKSVNRQNAKAKAKTVFVYFIIVMAIAATAYWLTPEYVVQGTVSVNQKLATLGNIGISGSAKTFELSDNFPGHFEVRGLNRTQTTVSLTVSLKKPFEVVRHDIPVEVVNGRISLNLETDLGKVLDLERDIAIPLARHLQSNEQLSPLTPYAKGDRITLRIKLDNPTSSQVINWSKSTEIMERTYVTIFTFNGDFNDLKEGTSYTIACEYEKATQLGPQKIQVYLNNCQVIP